jgi:hypothetical protein
LFKPIFAATWPDGSRSVRKWDTPLTTESAASIDGDLLCGADDIAAFLCGEAKHRKIYSLVETNRLPQFVSAARFARGNRYWSHGSRHRKVRPIKKRLPL